MGLFRRKVARRKRKKSRARPVMRVICFIAVFVFVVCMFFPLFSRKLELGEKKQELTEKIAQIDQKNKDLRHEIKQLETNSFLIEKIAREELGLTKPGEIVYKIISE